MSRCERRRSTRMTKPFSSSSRALWFPAGRRRTAKKELTSVSDVSAMGLARPGSIRRSVAEEAHDVVHATEPRLGESSGAHRLFLPRGLLRAQLAGRSTD